MRMFGKGTPFMDVPEEAPLPNLDECQKTPHGVSVFSEAFLYPRVGKGDARFVLAVAEEYERLIDVLGEDLVATLLERKLSRMEREYVQRVITDAVAT